MDVDLVIAAAVNVEADLDVVVKQADGKGNTRQCWGKGKALPARASPYFSACMLQNGKCILYLSLQVNDLLHSVISHLPLSSH